MLRNKITIVGAGNVGLRGGRLADIAPTLLDIMEIEVPPDMTGRSLIVPLAKAANNTAAQVVDA